jgi:2-keto-4-pentenoate hydratase
VSRPDVLAAAELLRVAARTGQPCAPLRGLIDESDQDAAYKVQSVGVERRIGAGRRVIGRKIGLTSFAVQRQLRVHSPDFGTLFDDMTYSDREPVPLTRFLQPRVEAEVAFVLGADLDLERPNAADVVRATDFVLPAIEVVDSRIRDWDITIADTIADNASSGAVVLGTTPRNLYQLDLADVGMVLEHRAEVVSSGAAAACLGNPIAAVVWLARVLQQQGSLLRAGDVVLSGALGPVVPVTGSSAFTARLSGLGTVTAVFVEGGKP